MLPLLNFSITEDGDEAALTKSALIFVTGEHKDSMGRVHNFDDSRVLKYVANTNKHLEMGGRLPIQMDHKKTQDFNIGDVESNLYTKIITATDLPKQQFKHLIGRLGVFVDNAVIKSKKAIADVKAGIIGTLSPGLDPMTESFIEVSATPTPAIIGPALFSKDGTEEDNFILFEMVQPKDSKAISDDKKAFSFEELKQAKADYSEQEKAYEELSKDLFTILCSLAKATEEELAAKNINPIEASYDAIEHFLSNLEEMFELTQDPDEDPKTKYLENSNTPYPKGQRESDFSRDKTKIIGFVL